MLYIICFIGTLMAAGIAACVVGIPLTVLRANNVLAFDVRLWWTLGCVIALIATRAGVLVMNDLSVPTDKLQLGVYQFQMFGCFAGVLISWIVGIAVLGLLSTKFSSIGSSVGSGVGLVCVLCLAGYLYAWPGLAKRSHDASRAAFVDALKAQDTAAVQRMISSGYEPQSRYSELDVDSPLCFAMSRGNESLVKVLLANQAREAAVGFIGAAVASQKREIVEMVLDHGDRSQDLLGIGLKNAIIDGDREYFDYFLSLGADPNYQYSHTVLMQAAGNGRIEFAKELLSRGAKVNTMSTAPSDYTGCTALIWAVRKGHRDMVQLLLNHGADINLHNPKEASALIAAARNHDNEMVRILLHNGADVSDTQRGKTVLELLKTARKPNVEMIELIQNLASATEPSP